jgi:hypothetical protein
MFPNIMIKTFIATVSLKSILFTLLHNMFTLLPIEGHDVKKYQTDIHFPLKKLGA